MRLIFKFVKLSKKKPNNALLVYVVSWIERIIVKIPTLSELFTAWRDIKNETLRLISAIWC